MEFKKVLLLFSVSLTFSLCKQIKENEQLKGQFEVNVENVATNDEISKSRQREQDCVCFPKSKGAIPVSTHLKQTGGDIERTVVYVYRDSNNRYSLYIPNNQKQAYFLDLTYDEGDSFTPVLDEYVDMLFSKRQPQSDSTEYKVELSKPLQIQNVEDIKITNLPSPINIQIPQEQIHLYTEHKHSPSWQPSINSNQEALLNMLNPFLLYPQNIVGFKPKDMQSGLLFNSDPQIRCFKGVCKYYFYCLRDECMNNLLSFSNSLRHVHLQPHLANLGIVLENNIKEEINNSEFQIPHVGELSSLDKLKQNVGNLLENVHIGALKDLSLGKFVQTDMYSRNDNPNDNVINHDAGKQLAAEKLIPNLNIQGRNHVIQNVNVPNSSQNILSENQNNNQILSTEYKNMALNYLPVPLTRRSKIRNVSGQVIKRGNTIDTELVKNIANLPAEIAHDSFSNLLSIIPGFNILGRSDQANNNDIGVRSSDMPIKEESAEAKTQSEEDELNIRIIGGNPATSSGTPMQVKGRLGNSNLRI